MVPLKDYHGPSITPHPGGRGYGLAGRASAWSRRRRRKPPRLRAADAGPRCSSGGLTYGRLWEAGTLWGGDATFCPSDRRVVSGGPHSELLLVGDTGVPAGPGTSRARTQHRAHARDEGRLCQDCHFYPEVRSCSGSPSTAERPSLQVGPGRGGPQSIEHSPHIAYSGEAGALGRPGPSRSQVTWKEQDGSLRPPAFLHT